MAERKAPNWKKIKAEYLKGGISQRKLAEKYGVSINTLRKKASDEKWAAERDELYTKVTPKIHQKIEEKIVEESASAIDLIQETSMLLLEQLAAQARNMPKTMGTRLEHTVVETKEGADGSPKRTTVKMTTDLQSMVATLEKFATMFGVTSNGPDTDIEDLVDLRKAVFGDNTQQDS